MTSKSTAMNFLRREQFALPRRSLFRPIRQAIPAIIKLRQGQAHRRLTGEEVIRVCKILETGKATYALRNNPRKHIMRHIQLLQTQHPSNFIRQRPHQFVNAHIKHRQILQKPNLRRQTRPQPIVHHYYLIQPAHVPQARRNAAVELVISQHNHRHR